MRVKERIAFTVMMAALFLPGPLELTIRVTQYIEQYGWTHPFWIEFIWVWGLYLIGLGFIWWLYGRRRV